MPFLLLLPRIVPFSGAFKPVPHSPRLVLDRHWLFSVTAFGRCSSGALTNRDYCAEQGTRQRWRKYPNTLVRCGSPSTATRSLSIPRLEQHSRLIWRDSRVEHQLSAARAPPGLQGRGPVQDARGESAGFNAEIACGVLTRAIRDHASSFQQRRLTARNQ